MARRKSKAKSGIDSLIETGLEIVGNLAYRALWDWWHSPAEPEHIPAKEHSPPTPEPPPKKTRSRKPPAWWKVLGVPQDATREQIARAYRDLMTGCHPDKVAHLSPELRKVAEREAKKLNAAREAALQDCDRR